MRVRLEEPTVNRTPTCVDGASQPPAGGPDCIASAAPLDTARGAELAVEGAGASPVHVVLAPRTDGKDWGQDPPRSRQHTCLAENKRDSKPFTTRQGLSSWAPTTLVIFDSGRIRRCSTQASNPRPG